MDVVGTQTGIHAIKTKQKTPQTPKANYITNEKYNHTKGGRQCLRLKIELNL